MGLPVNVTLGLDKLVETVANATGLTALGTIMNAKGEAKAEAILAKKRAETSAEVDILRMQGQEKVAQYMLARNNQKVENVGKIIAKAEQQFTSDEKVSSEPVDNNWMTRFLDIAESISDDDLRDLWARVLAGEVKRPNSYSLRTLDVLRNITKKEADLIVKCSNFVMGDLICTEDFALTLDEQLLLDDIGIIHGEQLYTKLTPTTGKMQFLLNRQMLLWIYAPVNLHMSVKCQKLTKAGRDIICLIQENDYVDFAINLAQHLKKQGARGVTVNKILAIKGTEIECDAEEIDLLNVSD